MNAQVKKMMDACPSYMIAEWALPALINVNNHIKEIEKNA